MTLAYDGVFTSESPCDTAYDPWAFCLDMEQESQQAMLTKERAPDAKTENLLGKVEISSEIQADDKDLSPAGPDYKGFDIRIDCAPKLKNTDGKLSLLDLSKIHLKLDKKENLSEVELKAIENLAEEIRAINALTWLDRPVPEMELEIPGHDAATGLIRRFRPEQTTKSDTLRHRETASPQAKPLGPEAPVKMSLPDLELSDFLNTGKNATESYMNYVRYASKVGFAVKVDITDLKPGTDISEQLAQRTLKAAGFSDEAISAYGKFYGAPDTNVDTTASIHNSRRLKESGRTYTNVQISLLTRDVMRQLEENLRNGKPPEYNPHLSMGGKLAGLVGESGIGTNKENRGYGDAAAAGAANGSIGVGQFLSNVTNIAEIASKKLLGLWDKEDDRQSRLQEFYDRLEGERAASGIPEDS